MTNEKFYQEPVPPTLLPAEGQQLTQYERDVLWQIVVQIGVQWDNVFSTDEFPQDSANLKSSWLEFLEAKTSCDPSYAAEYSSATKVVEELIAEFGEEGGFERLFFDREFVYGEAGEEKQPSPRTRLAHAKTYVVDEFIHVQLVASGFKFFGERAHRGRNYKGYIGGSRYNRKARVRSYEPRKKRAR